MFFGFDINTYIHIYVYMYIIKLGGLMNDIYKYHNFIKGSSSSAGRK